MAETQKVQAYKKNGSQGHEVRWEKTSTRQGSGGGLGNLLALQKAAGNQAVSNAVQGWLPSHVKTTMNSSGRPLNKKIQSEMENKFGYDFGGVRIHTDSRADASAQSLTARAYTVDHDIVFAANQYSPNKSAGKELLAHELVHVIQQSRGGNKPRLDPGSSHEQSAGRAAKAAIYGAGPVVVNGATGVGIARAVNDWLIGTPDFSKWSDTEILFEIDEIQQWLNDQIESNEDTARMNEVIDMLQKESERREKGALKPSKKKGRLGRKRKRRRKRQQDDREVASEQSIEKPRILQERTSIQYTDPIEMQNEYDLIMAWLRRDDLNKQDREILQMEQQNLAPLVHEERLQKVVERRANKIQQALTPKVSADARSQLVETVKLIDNIKPLSGRPGFSYLMYESEMIVLQDSEADAIRGGITKLMDEAVGKIKGVNESTMNRWSYQAKVEREEAFAGWVVSLFTGEEAPGIFDKMDPFLGASANNLARYRAMSRQGKLVQMAEAIGKAEENAIKAKLIVDNWIDESISMAGNIVTGLTITRDLSFSIVTSYFGGAGLLSLTRSGMGLAKAGLVVTAAGAGGTAVARGGSNLAGQALAGGPIDLGEVGSETLSGLKQGTVNTLTGAVTAGTGSALGQGTTLTGRVVRSTASGMAGGSVGGGTGAILEGKSAGEVVESTARGGLAGGIGGALSGATSPLLSNRSAATRFLTGSGTGALEGAGSAWITGGSSEDIKQGAIMGAISGGVTALPSPQSSRPPQHQRKSTPRSKGVSNRQQRSKSDATNDDIDQLINQLETGGESGGFQGEGPAVRIPVRRSQSHSPDIAQPPARILEVGSGRIRTNLGIPTQRKLVATTRTDIRGRKAAAVSTRGVHHFDATTQVPPEFIGQFDSIMINNPRRYTPNISELGRALHPGGRIIVQGRGATNRKHRGINPDFQRLLDADPPPGYRKIIDLPPPAAGLPQHAAPESILGGPFFRTSGEGRVLPNARIIYERKKIGG